MTTLNRKRARNVHFYDASDPDIALGGLRQNGSITEENFLDMLDMLLIVEVRYSVKRRQGGHVITRSKQSLEVGDYDIYSNGNLLFLMQVTYQVTFTRAGTIGVTTEAWIARVKTSAASGKEDKFKRGIRHRDGKCVFSGLVNINAEDGNWVGFEAAHIFPLAAESEFNAKNLGQWITDTEPGKSKINSLQNGFLMQATLHGLWVSYLISVNPDDNYKIVVFSRDTWGLDGKILDPVCRNPQDPHHVCDQLLRWHFRQCVFANMRAAGEPIFEQDYPSGSDMMGELRQAPFGKEQFELMLEDRL